MRSPVILWFSKLEGYRVQTINEASLFAMESRVEVAERDEKTLSLAQTVENIADHPQGPFSYPSSFFSSFSDALALSKNFLERCNISWSQAYDALMNEFHKPTHRQALEVFQQFAPEQFPRGWRKQEWQRLRALMGNIFEVQTKTRKFVPGVDLEDQVVWLDLIEGTEKPFCYGLSFSPRRANQEESSGDSAISQSS